MQEYIVTIKPSGLVCSCLKQHMLVSVTEIPSTQQALMHWVNTHSVKQAKIIIDLPDEERYVEPYPKLYSWEVASFVERQMKRKFPGSEFAKYVLVKNNPSLLQASDGKIYLSGYNDTKLLQEVLLWLERLEVLVSSIHSSTTLLTKILQQTWFESKAQQKQLSQSPVLFLVKENAHNYRQLLLIDGEVHTNRYVSLPIESHEVTLKQLVQEINLLSKFAHTQKLLLPDEEFSIYYLGDDQADEQRVYQSLLAADLMQDNHRNQVANVRHFLAEMSVQHHLEKLMSVTLSASSLLPDYQTKFTQKVKTVQKTKLVLWAMIIMLLFAGLNYFSAFLTKQHETEEAIQTLEVTKESQKRYIARFMRYNDIESLSKYELKNIKLAVETYETIQTIQQKQVFYPALIALSRALAQDDKVMLIGMTVSTDKNVDAKANRNQSNQPKEVVTGQFQKLVLSLGMEVKVKDKLSVKIAQADAFVELLNQEASNGYVAHISQVPFDVSSDHDLSFKIENGRSTANFLANFEVTLMVNHE